MSSNTLTIKGRHQSLIIVAFKVEEEGGQADGSDPGAWYCSASGITVWLCVVVQSSKDRYGSRLIQIPCGIPQACMHNLRVALATSTAVATKHIKLKTNTIDSLQGAHRSRRPDKIGVFSSLEIIQNILRHCVDVRLPTLQGEQTY